MKNRLFILIFFAAVLVSFVSCGEKENPEREDELTDIVFKDPGDAQITVGSNSSSTVEFTSREPWRVSINSISKSDKVSWLKVDPVSGPAGNAVIKITTSQINEDTDTRYAEIYLQAGESHKTIVVTQEGTEIISLVQKSDTLDLNGGEIEVPVRHNIDYDISIPGGFTSWIKHVEPSKALPVITKEKFKVEGTLNFRVGEIYFRYRNQVDTFTVIQTGANLINGKFIGVHPAELNMKSEGESRIVKVYANTEYAFKPHYGYETTDQEWFSVVFSDNVATVTVKPNPLGVVRKGYIEFQSKEEQDLRTVLVITQSFAGAAEIVEIPDARFKDLLLLSYDTDGDGEINRTEALGIYNLILTGSGISDLTGIEYFKYLRNLYCTNNNLTHLNIKGLSKLEKLECSDNKLETLDLNGLGSLESVLCDKNKITSMNVAGCKSLAHLVCDNNLIETLNLDGLGALSYLSCENNKITSIHLSGTDIKEFLCANNLLTALDLTACRNLENLYCSKNKLTSLNVSGLSKLMNLYADDNLMTSVNVNGCPELKHLDLRKNKLAGLNVTWLLKLKYLFATENPLLTSFNSEGCFELMQLEIFNNPELCSVNVKNCLSLTSLDISDMKIASLELDGCSALTSLDCDNNQMTALSMPALENLSTLNLRNNKLQTVDVSLLPKLNRLDIDDNPVKSLNISGTSFTSFRSRQGVLESVNAADCTMLEKLELEENNMNDLNITGCSALKEISCNSNKLSSIDFKGCDNLQVLWLNDNIFTSFNASVLPALTNLMISRNKLASINVLGNQELRQVVCNSNELTSIDVSNRSKMKALECKDNKIEILRASGCSEMTKIDATNNKMKTLDLVGLLKLQELYVEGNTFEDNIYLSQRPPYFRYTSSGQEVEIGRDDTYVYSYLKPAIYVNGNLSNTIHKTYLWAY